MVKTSGLVDNSRRFVSEKGMTTDDVVSQAKNAEHAARLRRFKPYPAYKDSGVEWLGEIPAHWDVKPLKRALRSGNADGSLNKGRMHQEPGEGLFPGFSASGQDIWV